MSALSCVSHLMRFLDVSAGTAYFIVVLGRTDILTLAGNKGVRLRLQLALACDLRRAFLLPLVFAILTPSRWDWFPYSPARAGPSARRLAARTARQRSRSSAIGFDQEFPLCDNQVSDICNAMG